MGAPDADYFRINCRLARMAATIADRDMEMEPVLAIAR
jgi:hypothetical protein